MEDQNYIGPLPDLENFSPETRSDKVRQELINWHNEMREKGFVINFREEMYQYCAQDVTILRLYCMKFRELFVSETKLIRLYVLYCSRLCHGDLSRKLSSKRYDWHSSQIFVW